MDRFFVCMWVCLYPSVHPTLLHIASIFLPKVLVQFNSAYTITINNAACSFFKFPWNCSYFQGVHISRANLGSHMLGCFSLVNWGNWTTDTKFFDYDLRVFVPFRFYTHAHTKTRFCPFALFLTPSFFPSFHFKDPQLESWGFWPQCLCAFCKQHIVAHTRELANQTWACVSSRALEILVLKYMQAFSRLSLLKRHMHKHAFTTSFY